MGKGGQLLLVMWLNANYVPQCPGLFQHLILGVSLKSSRACPITHLVLALLTTVMWFSPQTLSLNEILISYSKYKKVPAFVRNSGYLCTVIHEWQWQLLEIFPLVLPSENPQILMEFLEIPLGAIERTWPMCCLFFPKHILCFSQCISSQSTKSLNQKLKILEDNEGWLIFIFNFIDLEEYQFFCYPCLLHLFLPLILSNVCRRDACGYSGGVGLQLKLEWWWKSGHGNGKSLSIGVYTKVWSQWIKKKTKQ